MTSEEITTQLPRLKQLKVRYDVYPTGIGISTSINSADYVAQTETVNATEKEVSFNGGVIDGATSQVKIILTPSGSNVPKIKSIILQ
ncbi:MAG: hypothetical protein UT03_C0064G0003 [Candidatus Moranbacteria bacterium GW2011_GWD2_38_7]|nr:MAG: hypothetical protein UT03_C0064G0003 [Candidatus Moranbacteria bacterium GW2011_GWD2_38_7]